MAVLLEYVVADTPLHRLHPGTKLFGSLAILVLGLFFYHPVPLALLTLGILAVAAVGGVFRETFRYCQALAFFGLLLLIVHLLAGGGVGDGLVLVFRMISIAGSFPVLLGSTQPRDIVIFLVDTLKVPYDYAFMFITALRFIPTFLGEIRLISQAQEARGFSFQGKGLLARIKAYGPIAVPLVLSSLRKAEQLAVSMETRAYGSGPRTYLRRPAWTGVDMVVVIGLCGLMLGIGIVRYL